MSKKGFIVSIILLLAADSFALAERDWDPTKEEQNRRLGRLQLFGMTGAYMVDHSLGSASNIYQTVTGEAQSIRFGKLFGFRTSWAFTRNLTIEFNLSNGNNVYTLYVDDNEVGSVDLGNQFAVKNLNMGGSIVVELPRGRFVPYVTGGVGLQRAMPKRRIVGVERVSSFDYNFGGGVKLWLKSPRWLGIRMDARYHSTSHGISFTDGTSSPKGIEFTAGVVVNFF